MNSKLYLCFTLLFLIGGKTFAQNDFRSGYIITAAQDTLRGELDYLENANNYRFCIFRYQGKETKYNSRQIREYAFDGDRHFSATVLKGEFVEIVARGPVSLYASRDLYFVQKDTLLFALESRMEDQMIDGKLVQMEKGRWRNILSMFVSDCLPDASKKISRVQLKRKSLTRLVNDYNQCQGWTADESKIDKPWTKVRFGFVLGLSRAQIDIVEQQPLAFPPDKYSTWMPSIGLMFDLSAPKYSERTSLETLLMYSTSHYKAKVYQQYGVSDRYHTTQIRLHTLSLPATVKYNMPFKEQEFDLYFQGGVNIDYQFSSNSTYTLEQTFQDNINTYSYDDYYPLSKVQLGLSGGIGFSKAFPKFRASMSLNYTHMGPMDRDFRLEAYSKRWALRLLLSKN